MPRAPALRGKTIRAEADVRLIGDDDESEPMHSILLMTLSPYFQIILNDTDKPKLVRIVGANAEILKMIRDYAYSGGISGLSKDNVESLYRVADMYNIIGLINECKLFMTNNQINWETILQG